MNDKLNDDPIMISALEHWSYCPRQCALIHVEQTFEENLYTMRGQAVHKRVDEPESETVDGIRVERAVPLKNYERLNNGPIHAKRMKRRNTFDL